MNPVTLSSGLVENTGEKKRSGNGSTASEMCEFCLWQFLNHDYNALDQNSSQVEMCAVIVMRKNTITASKVKIQLALFLFPDFEQNHLKPSFNDQLMRTNNRTHRATPHVHVNCLSDKLRLSRLEKKFLLCGRHFFVFLMYTFILRCSVNHSKINLKMNLLFCISSE